MEYPYVVERGFQQCLGGHYPEGVERSRKKKPSLFFSFGHGDIDPFSGDTKFILNVIHLKCFLSSLGL